MSKAQLQQDNYDNLINDYVDSRNNVGFHFLKMAQVIAEAKHRLSKKMFKLFLKDKRINLKRLQANKMITVYEFSKSDSRLTYFLNREGIEKSYLITTIKNEDNRNSFTEAIIDTSFTVKQTRQAIEKMNLENKTSEVAVKEVQNKIISSNPKKTVKTVSLIEYENLKKENEELKLKLQEFEEKQTEKIVLKNEEIKEQTPTNLGFLN